VTPYYEDEAVSIFLGDCREIVSSLPVPDVTIADPPYGETSLEWDRWVPGWPALMPGNALWCFGSMRMFLERAGEFAPSAPGPSTAGGPNRLGQPQPGR
jgi:site-specific DNA-methyltransferase (adenine-specific)